MSGVAPVGSLQESSPNRKEEELDRLEQSSATQPSTEDTSSQLVKTDESKQAEKTTLYGFRYTGMGSFIDKVF